MTFIDWSDALSVQVPMIDHEHQKLIEIINDLHAVMENEKRDITMVDIVERLMDYIKTHFATEERLMTEYKYPDQHSHEVEHFKLTTQVGQYFIQINNGKSIAPFEMMDFLKDWLHHHLLEVDQKMGAYLAERMTK